MIARHDASHAVPRKNVLVKGGGDSSEGICEVVLVGSVGECGGYGMHVLLSVWARLFLLITYGCCIQCTGTRAIVDSEGGHTAFACIKSVVHVGSMSRFKRRGWGGESVLASRDRLQRLEPSFRRFDRL